MRSCLLSIREDDMHVFYIPRICVVEIWQNPVWSVSSTFILLGIAVSNPYHRFASSSKLITGAGITQIPFSRTGARASYARSRRCSQLHIRVATSLCCESFAKRGIRFHQLKDYLIEILSSRNSRDCLTTTHNVMLIMCRLETPHWVRVDAPVPTFWVVNRGTSHSISFMDLPRLPHLLSPAFIYTNLSVKVPGSSVEVTSLDTGLIPYMWTNFQLEGLGA